mmetsp:Transcript_17554/g.39682  ORF Transcript_17554/g.39682 Transcript_17554/m.39682 type:complete len:85 (-) Transcript_17554:1014-1268(-)
MEQNLRRAVAKVRQKNKICITRDVLNGKCGRNCYNLTILCFLQENTDWMFTANKEYVSDTQNPSWRAQATRKSHEYSNNSKTKL